MNHTVLALETSCDETAAAVYSTSHGILSNVLFSQISLHQQFGGVVPEIASRSHLEKITGIVQESLTQAQKTLQDITVIAVTNKPGLPGSLLVGVSFAKALAYGLQIPIIGINHLEGHIYSSFLEHSVPFPHLCLTASGGHTALYIVHDLGNYELLGNTRDDAAGEAFDKIAKLMDLSYPGGPLLERMATEVNFKDFFKYPRLKEKSLDFSFSGLKTAVLYDLIKKDAYNLPHKKFLEPHNELLKQQVASSLLVCIADIFQDRIQRAFTYYPSIKALTFVGGVAANLYIKNRLHLWAESKNIQFFSPAKQYCTDNAAMISFVGHYKAQQKLFDDLTLDIY